tara:strand:+ start:244 stop:564 length:321 start_codon:yes stop_codon:yes gene_type:complete
MKFTKILILLTCATIILNSCSSFKEAGQVLRNEKKKTTDEFLVKKQEPLTQPPDFEKIPEPGSILKNDNVKKNKFKEILRASQGSTDSKQTKSSSTEESILRQIKK